LQPLDALLQRLNGPRGRSARLSAVAAAAANGRSGAARARGSARLQVACRLRRGRPSVESERDIDMTTTAEDKLSSNWIWLFALGAALAGVGSGFLTSGLNWKIASAIYFGIFAIAGFCATYLTEATTGKGVIAFLLAAIATAVFYYLIVTYAVETVTGAVVDVGSGDAASKATAKDAGATFAGMFGMIVAAINGIGTAAAGISGCVAGSRFKRAGGLQQLAVARRA